jgi:ABC-2 type transport system permease protein
MKKIRTIAYTELQTLFYSPIAWLILVVFAVQTGFLFTNSTDEWLKRLLVGQNWAGLTTLIFDFRDMLNYLYLYIPLLTMGLISRELSSGSIKLLYSSPVSNTQIILGKYAAMLVYGLVLMGVLCCFVILGVFTIVHIDFPIVLTSLLGIYLLICAYAAVGLFMSCLTSYQVVAAMGTLALFAILSYVNHVGQSIELVRDITYWLSMTGRTTALLQGLISSEDILYFVIVIALFITLSIFALDIAKLKRSLLSNTLRFSSVVLIAMTAGYISSRPQLMAYADVTRTKENTLTQNSQKIVRQLKGPLTITTYVNLFERNASQALPGMVNFDKEHFKDYIRFKPDTKMKYVYYYAQNDQPSSIARYPRLTDKQRMERECIIEHLDPDIFLSKQELAKTIDLSPEHYRFVRMLETEDGKKIPLRLFNDVYKQPGEREITAALKRLAMKLPVVGFVQGHDARDIESQGDRGYNSFARDGSIRSALLNQGFDVQNLDLAAGPVPSLINIVVLPDIKTPLSATESRLLNDYIQKGGNLVIIGEPGRQAVLNPLVAPLGVDFLPGRLVQPQAEFAADLVSSVPTPEAAAMSYELSEFAPSEGVLVMPGACGLDFTADKGFTVTPWFVTSKQGGWNELQTTNFLDEKPSIDTATGETERSYPTVLALSRDIAGRQQKIIVMGDADCLDNAEMKSSHKGIRGMTGSFINGMFFWLSNGEVPIDVRRERPTDDGINLSLKGMSFAKLFYVWILPGLLAVMGIALWFIRKRR